MKNVIFTILACLGFLAGVASGQVATSGQQGVYTNTVQMPEHPQHASQHAMSAEQSLLDISTVTIAHGERPLWEFGYSKTEPSLGAFARDYREKHAKVEKARVVWNQ